MVEGSMLASVVYLPDPASTDQKCAFLPRDVAVKVDQPYFHPVLKIRVLEIK
jgi:hypothetical protein